MAEVIWSRTALNDLNAIRDWISRDAPRTADDFLSRLVTSCDERLSRQPERGRPVPEDDKRGLRQILFGYYRVIYRIRRSSPQVIGIFHSRRILDSKVLDHIERQLRRDGD